MFEIAKTGAGYATSPNTLASFNVTGAGIPNGGLVADAAGDLFGTTASGGTNGDGTVFEIAKTVTGYVGTPATLVSFSGTNGESPNGGLAIDAAGDLFGTTASGGASGFGTVFKIAKTNSVYATTPTVLVNFNGTNGDTPNGGLIADAAGDLFGTTTFGGDLFGTDYADNTIGFGTVFELSSAGFVAPPSVTGVVTQPSSGVVSAGASITIALDFSGVVMVAGAPTLALDDGATATYSGGSGSSALTFSDTVAADDANVAALAASAVNLNGGSITSSGGGTADLSLAGLPQAGPQIDTDANFVQQVYETVLQRQADAGGLSAWTGALESNAATRTQLVADFVGSSETQEFVLPVARLYQTFFDRAPDPSGMSTWVNALRNGVSINTVAADFIGSPEFAQHYPNLTPSAFVTALYENVLERAPDSAGDQAWVNFLNQGQNGTATQAAAALGFANSPEFIGDSTGAIDAWLTSAAETGSYPSTIVYPSAQLMAQSIASSAPAQGAGVMSASEPAQAAASEQFLAQSQHA